jgi:hypothetical protein
VEGDLPEARRNLKELQKHAGDSFSLNESQFCRQCSPEAKEPKLVLTIECQDGRSHTTAGISPTDLLLLNEFFSGKFVHDDGPAGEAPLKNYEKRLQELLGMNQ